MRESLHGPLFPISGGDIHERTDTLSAEREESVLPENQPRFLQFRLSSIFVLTFVMAAACSLLFSMPPMPGLLLLLVFSAVFPAGDDHHHLRTQLSADVLHSLFPMGLLLGTVCFLLTIVLIESDNLDRCVRQLAGDENWLWFRLIVGGVWVLSVVTGLICVGATTGRRTAGETLNRSRKLQVENGGGYP